jgi:Macrocin-O-methyltransferase (TylF)
MSARCGEHSVNACGSPEKCEANQLFRNIKDKVKHQLTRQLLLAAKDIDSARQFRAAQESAEFVDQHMRIAKSYPDKFALLKAAVSQIEVQGLCCEFGVYGGETINFISSLIAREVHGFDSFEGLPEDWRQGQEKGTFAVGALPRVRFNAKLYEGWFRDTLPAFLEQHPGPVAFLHLNADLHSSTRMVFELLGDRIVPGTVIAFGEFFNYPGWREGDYRVFTEFCRERRAEVRYLGFVGRDEQAVAKISGISHVSDGIFVEDRDLTPVEDRDLTPVEDRDLTPVESH